MSSPITQAGIEVRVGQVWRDLDRRARGRYCRVIAIDQIGPGGQFFAVMKRCLRHGAPSAATTRSRVAVRRMHRHSTGWELVSGPS